jgi:hypothetical protein
MHRRIRWMAEPLDRRAVTAMLSLNVVMSVALLAWARRRSGGHADEQCRDGGVNETVVVGPRQLMTNVPA